MTFLHQRHENVLSTLKNIACLSKKTFEISLVLLIKEVSEQTAAFSYYEYGYFLHDQQTRPSNNVISTFVASSLVSNYGLKILASSKDRQKCE